MNRPLGERLRRVERQLRTLGELHVAELTRLGEGAGDPVQTARKLHTIARLQADEIRLVLDEIRSVIADVDPAAGDAAAGTPEAPANPAAGTPEAPADPAADSPKRARWQAEEERRAHRPPVSRRELLFGREEGEDER